MMRIDKHNYEAYLLDYLEGDLQGDALKAMEDFLAEHPDILREAEGLPGIHLHVPDITYPFRDELKRDANIPPRFASHDEWFAAYAGGELAPDEMRNVLDHVENQPALHKSLQAYAHTRLVPDFSIQYPDKTGLKKAIPLFGFSQKRITRLAWAAAAVMGLLLTTVWVARIAEQEQSYAPGMVQVQEDRPASSAHPPATSQKIREIPTQEMETVSLASGEVKPARQEAVSTRTPASDTRGELQQRQPTPALQLASLTAKVSLTEGKSKNHTQGIILPRFQSAGVNNRYLAAEWTMPTDEGRGGLALQVAQWLGIGRKSESSPDVLDPNAVLWAMADRGVNFFNILTDNEVQLYRSTDEDGNVVAYALVSGRFEIARKQQRD